MTTYRYTAVIEYVQHPAAGRTIEIALTDRLGPFGFTVVEVSGPEAVAEPIEEL